MVREREDASKLAETHEPAGGHVEAQKFIGNSEIN
jgi:hypothetical protein